MDTKNYEFTYILSPRLTDEEAEAWNGRIENIIKNLRGTMLAAGNASRMRLSYPLKKEFQGISRTVTLMIEPGLVSKILEELEHEPLVLRSLIVHEMKRPEPRQAMLARMSRGKAAPAEGEAKPAAAEEKTIENTIQAKEYAAAPATVLEEIEREHAARKETETEVQNAAAVSETRKVEPAVHEDIAKTDQKRVKLEDIEKHLEQILKE